MPTTERTPYNLDLMLKIRKQITEHPETHDQQVWACGTTACIAGWAVQLAGYTLKWMDPEEEGGAAEAYFVRLDQDVRGIDSLARTELGLSGSEARALFSSNNSEAEAAALLDRFIAAAAAGKRLGTSASLA